MPANEREQINAWANRALENVQGGWYALAESQLRLIIEATGGLDTEGRAPGAAGEERADGQRPS